MARKNFPISTIQVAPSPALSGTDLSVTTGHAARYHDVPFFATAHPPGVVPTIDNSEVVEVTGWAGDQATIVRAQRGTSAKSIANGWILVAPVYVEDLFTAPSSSTDNALVRFDGTSGNIQNSGITLSDAGSSVDLVAAVQIVIDGEAAGLQLKGDAGNGVYVFSLGDITLDADGVIDILNDNLQTNIISERTAAAGVTIDGVILKDNNVDAAGWIEGVAGVYSPTEVGTNVINEYNGGSGVTIDGLLIKDGGINGVTIVTVSGIHTLTNKRITPRVLTIATAPDVAGTYTLTPGSDDYDQFNITAQANPLTIAAPTGTPTSGQKIMIRLKDDGTARALTWNSAYRAIGVTLPTTTVLSKTLYIGAIWNATDSKWDVIAVAQEA